MLNFSRESITNIWHELKDLLHLNSMETGLKDERFDPSLERYSSIEQTGIHRMYTIRDDGKIVGYCSMFVSNHIHYPDGIWAHQDVLFVHPNYRGITAVRFMRFVDHQLKLEGVTKILRQVTTKKDFSRTLERMGYEPLEVLFARSM